MLDLNRTKKGITSEYTIIKSNRKSVTLVIDKDGQLVVRAPRFITNREIARLVEAKQDWIKKRTDEIQKVNSLRSKMVMEDGSAILFLGSERKVHIGDYRRITLTEDEIQIPTVHDPEKMFMKWLKKQALDLLLERTQYYAELMNLTYEAVKLSNARTSWGTCTSKQILRFSWRLIFCPVDKMDYVVVHELSHINHMNHSREFWACVETVMPDYKTKRKWLKAHSYYMDL